MNIELIASQIFAHISQLSGPTAYGTIVGILFICGFGLPIPEDIVLLSAGLLASQGKVRFFTACVAGLIGVVMGDSIIFLLGRHFGKRVFGLPLLRRLFTPSRIARAEKLIRKEGPVVCFVARFLPGVRTCVFALSGALGVRPAVFICLDGLAALISVPLWIFVGFKVGGWLQEDFGSAWKHVRHFEGEIFAVVGGLIVVYLSHRIYRRARLRRKAVLAQSPQL